MSFSELIIALIQEDMKCRSRGYETSEYLEFLKRAVDELYRDDDALDEGVEIKT